MRSFFYKHEIYEILERKLSDGTQTSKIIDAIENLHESKVLVGGIYSGLVVITVGSTKKELQL